jgi:hypothetical protein
MATAKMNSAALIQSKMSRSPGRASNPWQSSWGGPACNRWTVGPSAINEFRANFIRQYYNTLSPSRIRIFPRSSG